MRNIGRDLTSVREIRTPDENDPGFQITYSNGDICDHNPRERYSTKIIYVCDMEETTYGYPVIQQGSSQCEFEIPWFTKYACPACNALTDIDYKMTTCD